MTFSIVGASKAGKTTLFNAIAVGHSAGPVLMRGTKLKVNGVTVPVLQDERVIALTQMHKPKDISWPTMTFHDMDISGLGISNSVFHSEVLHHLSTQIGLIHVAGKYDDVRSGKFQEEYEVIENEFRLHDAAMVDNKLAKFNRKTTPEEKELFEQLQECLAQDQPLRDLLIDDEQLKIIKSFGFLSRKPHVTVYNLNDSQETPKIPASEEGNIFAIRSEVERELAEMEESERAEFLSEYGMKELLVPKLIGLCKQISGTRDFFTVGDDEVKTWSLKPEATILEAAGSIHSRLQKGFIKGEVVFWKDLIAEGDWETAKQIVDRKYLLNDGDCVYIRAK